MNFEFRQKPVSFKTAILAVILAITTGTIFLLINGYNPSEVYYAIIKGSLLSRFSISSTLRWTTPLLFCALAAGIGFKGGMFNMGVEGQLYIGGMAAAWVGFTFSGLNPFLHVSLCILAGMFAGALYAFIPAALRVFWDVNEVVVTLMLNYVAMYFTDYLVSEHFLAEGVFGDSLASRQLFDSARLPAFSAESPVTISLVIALVLVVIYWYFFSKSQKGYEIHISGINPEFARYSGISVNKARITVMLISGAIAGLAGSMEIMGQVGRFLSRFSPNFGQDGMLAALLGSSSPLGILFSSAFMGILKAGSLAAERNTDVSRALAIVIQGIIICFVSARMLNFKETKIGISLERIFTSKKNAKKEGAANE